MTEFLTTLVLFIVFALVEAWIGRRLFRSAETRALGRQAQLRAALVELVDAVPSPETATQRAALQHARRVLAYAEAER